MKQLIPWLLSFVFSFPVFAIDPSLRSAFSRFVPDQSIDEETPTQMDRLAAAIDQRGELEADIDQILEAHRINSLEALFHELNGRRHEYRKLTPTELAAVIKFYQSRDPKRNQLIRNGARLYDYTSTARSAVEVTSFPFVEIREHGHHHPQIPYTDAMSRTWAEAFRPFKERELKWEFMELWSQMVNQSAGHVRYRHLEGFEFRFLHELRRWTISTQDYERGLQTLVAYLTSFNTSRVVRRNGMNPAIWPKKERKGLAFALLSLSALRNDPKSLQKLFDYGDLPPSLLSISSIQLTRVILTFQQARRYNDIDVCLRQLVDLDAHRDSGKTRSR